MFETASIIGGFCSLKHSWLAAALAGLALADAASTAAFDAGIATSDMLQTSRQLDEELILLLSCWVIPEMV